MTIETASVPTHSLLARILACLPGIATFSIYFEILPALRANFPSLTPYERHLVLQWDNTLIPQITLFALTIGAIIYQKRIRRTWPEAFFWIINILFALFMSIPLALTLLGIDFMPRQL